MEVEVTWFLFKLESDRSFFPPPASQVNESRNYNNVAGLGP